MSAMSRVENDPARVQKVQQTFINCTFYKTICSDDLSFSRSLQNRCERKIHSCPRNVIAEIEKAFNFGNVHRQLSNSFETVAVLVAAVGLKY